MNRNNSKRSSFSGLKSRKGDQLRVREGGRNLGGFSFLFPLPCPSTQANSALQSGQSRIPRALGLAAPARQKGRVELALRAKVDMSIPDLAALG